MSFAHSLAKALGPTPYSSAYINETTWRRQRFSGSIGIDILLSYAGVSSSNDLYPPSNREALAKLVDAIETGGKSRVYQSRALFYLFLDFSDEETADAKTTVAQYYASQVWMNVPEQSLIKGIWLLDHGRAKESLEFLGQPWDLDGMDALHEYIIESLSDQRLGAVACYLAARGSSNTYSSHLVKSLALKGKFAEILDISRSAQNPDYLKETARAAIENKKSCLELAQLPCTTEEWNTIQEELNHVILTASPSRTDVNATNALARDIMLVRALHTGDTETLLELKGSSENADILIQKTVPN